MARKCAHTDQTRAVTARTDGCEECLLTGVEWVHLRLCLSCGHVGCCDDSKNKHATAHFNSSRHPIVESLEPGEGWRWCYVDELLIPSEIDVAGGPMEERRDVMTDLIRSVTSSTK